MALFSLGNTSRFKFNATGIEFLVVSLTAREKISAIFEVDLTLASQDEIPFKDVIGKNALLEIESTDTTRFFHGIVNRFVQTDMAGRFFMYQARIVPQIWLLSLEQDCRIFQSLSVPDIVKQILNDSGITSDIVEFRLQGNYQARDYCVQYRETDLAFISRLLEEEGIFYFFEHAKDKHVLIFGDGTACHKPIVGDDRVMYRPKSEMVSEQETAFTFCLKNEICTGKYCLCDFNFVRPDMDLTSGETDKENSCYEVYDYPGQFDTTEEGKRLAKIRLEESLVYKFNAQGDSTCPRFSPGATFHLTDHDILSLNQAYLIYEVTHKGDQPQVLQESATSESGTRYTNQFHAVPSDITYRPQRTTLKPAVEGVQTAIVTGPAGKEIYTDEHGRVKVQFHWDRKGKKDEKSSCWIRVSQTCAGAGWGSVDIPRIGHEVIVSFIEGNPDQPIITGRVYHGENRPPFDLPDSGMVSGIKSNSTPGGGGYNEISMNDTKGEEVMTIHAQYNQDATVENNRTTTIVGGNDTLSVQAGTRSVTVKGDTSLTVESGNRTVDINSGDCKITAAKSVSIHGKSTGVIVTGNSKGVSINGDGQGVKIKGDPNFDANGTSTAKIISPEVSIGDNTVKVTGSSTITLSSGGSTIELTPGGITITSGKIGISGNVTISGGKIDVTGGMVSIAGGVVMIN